MSLKQEAADALLASIKTAAENVNTGNPSHIEALAKAYAAVVSEYPKSAPKFQSGGQVR